MKGRNDGGPGGIPRTSWVPFVAKHGNGVLTCQIARHIERMNGHVSQQHVRHLLAKAAKMRGNKKVDMHRREVADDSVGDHLTENPSTPIESAVLHDHVNPTQFGGKGHKLASLSQRQSKWLFFQNVKADAHGLARDLEVGRRDGTVEKDICGHLAERSI